MIGVIPIFLTEEEPVWRSAAGEKLLRRFLDSVSHVDGIDTIIALTNEQSIAAILEEKGIPAHLLDTVLAAPKDRERHYPLGADAAFRYLEENSGTGPGDFALLNFRNPLITRKAIEDAIRRLKQSAATTMISVKGSDDHPCQLISYFQVRELGTIHLFEEKDCEGWGSLGNSPAEDTGRAGIMSRPFFFDWLSKGVAPRAEPFLFACRNDGSTIYYVPAGLADLHSPNDPPPVLWQYLNEKRARLLFSKSFLNSLLRSVDFDAAKFQMIGATAPTGETPAMILQNREGDLFITLPEQGSWGECVFACIPFTQEGPANDSWIELSLTRKVPALPLPVAPAGLSGMIFSILQYAHNDVADLAVPITPAEGLWSWTDLDHRHQVNLETGREIKGRQDFPDVWEPDGTFFITKGGAATPLDQQLADGLVEGYRISRKQQIQIYTSFDLLRCQALDNLVSKTLTPGTNRIGSFLKSMDKTSINHQNACCPPAKECPYSIMPSNMGMNSSKIYPIEDFSGHGLVLNGAKTSPPGDNALTALASARHKEFNRKERIKTASDILKINTLPKSKPPEVFCDSMETYIQNELRNGVAPELVEMEEKLQKDYLRLGDHYLKSGENDNAYAAWRQALKIQLNTELSPRLGGAKKSELLNRQKTISKFDPQYLFEYEGSFGRGRLSKPTFILTDKPNNRILVSDFPNSRVSLFDTGGNYLGELAQKLKKPCGMFTDINNAIWICEFDQSRLVGLNGSHQTDCAIELKNLLIGTALPTKPLFGVQSGDNLFLVLSNGPETPRFLLKITKFTTDPHIIKIQPGFAIRPIHPVMHKDRLYIGDMHRRIIFTLSRDKKLFTQTSNRGFPFDLKSIVFSGEDLFVACGKKIIKTTLQNDLIFTADLLEQTGEPSAPFHLSILEEGNRQYLLVSDFQQACIHKFVIKKNVHANIRSNSI